MIYILVEITTKRKREERRGKMRDTLIESKAKDKRGERGRKTINRLIKKKTKTKMSETWRKLAINRALEGIREGKMRERKREVEERRGRDDVMKVTDTRETERGMMLEGLPRHLECVCPGYLSNLIKIIKYIIEIIKIKN